jgi:beta-lactamase class A
MITLHRRKVAALALSGLATPALVSGARAQGAPKDLKDVERAIDRFSKLPVTSASCLVAADRQWSRGYKQSDTLFVGSAVKTFILAQYLRGVEAGRLTEGQPLAIDDSVRSPGSPVFGDSNTNGVLAGKTAARNVLEAMITHSDNTATDVALAAANVADVRALIKEAELTRTRIPTSTRRLFIYLASGKDQDMSWAEMLKLLDKPTNPQPALNPIQSMASSAEDMVNWYFVALAGKFFKKPETLLEFRRIQAMADSLVHVVPPDTMAYGKGGSIDWQDFHCFSLPGQMIVKGVPVAFCFTINWTGKDDTIGPTFNAYKAAVAAVLSEAAKAVN